MIEQLYLIGYEWAVGGGVSIRTPRGFSVSRPTLHLIVLSIRRRKTIDHGPRGPFGRLSTHPGSADLQA